MTDKSEIYVHEVGGTDFVKVMAVENGKPIFVTESFARPSNGDSTFWLALALLAEKTEVWLRRHRPGVPVVRQFGEV